MRIAIDAREIQDEVFTGIGRALMHFIRHFERGGHTDSAVLFSSKPLPFVFSGRIECRQIEAAPALWWDQRRLPAALDAAAIDLFYSPYYKTPLFARCKKVASVLDVMYLKYPPYLRQQSLAARLYYATIARACVNSADGVITSSEHSRKDIIDVYGTDPGKIHVLPLGVSRCYVPDVDVAAAAGIRESLGIRGRYILYAGNFKPHKNVISLIRHFTALTSVFSDLKLVLVAPLLDSTEYVRYAKDTLPAGRYVFTDTVTDENILRALYAGASAFVFPSLYEGFGLPPVEAMACGTPVVCSSASCLPETCAGAAALVDPASPEEFVRVLVRVLSDEPFRRQLREAGLKRVESIREEAYGAKLHGILRLVAGA